MAAHTVPFDTDATLRLAAERFAQAAREWSTSEEVTCDTLPTGLAELLSVLAEQPEWRVLVDGERNLGHQASSVTLLRGLIDLTGFGGKVVIVYVESGLVLLGCTADKLALMFTGVDPAHMESAVASYGTCHDIRFMPFARRNELRNAIAFGFTGGADHMSQNFAHELNVRFFVRMQPYLWDDPPSFRDDPHYKCSRIEQPDGCHLYLLESYPELQRLPVKPPASIGLVDDAVWRWYADDQRFDTALRYRTRNIRAILQLRGEGNIALWPLYGLQHFRGEAPEIMLTCVLAALRYSRQTRRPVVLCSFSPHEELEGYLYLSEALADDLALHGMRLSRLYAALCAHFQGLNSEKPISAEGLTTWIQATAAPLGDGETLLRFHRDCDQRDGDWTSLGATGSGAAHHHFRAEVHVVELGLVPMSVFNHCLIHADVPPVIEGQAASNLLASASKPFFQLVREQQGANRGVTLADPALEAAIRQAPSIRALLPRRQCMTDNSQNAIAGTGIEQLVRFMQQENETSGAGNPFANNRTDKLLVTLLGLREVMLANTIVDQGRKIENG